MRILSLALLLLLIPSAQALDIDAYQVTYDIQPSLAVQETVSITFTEPLPSASENFIRLGDATHVLVQADGEALDLGTDSAGTDVKVTFTIPAGTEQLDIGFLTNTLIFSSGDIQQFFVNLEPPEDAVQVGVAVILPRGFVIHRDTYSPSNPVLGGDGERISLSWSLENTGFLPISVQFEPVVKTNDLLLPGLGVAAAAALVVIVLFFRRRTQQNFLLTFFEDERKVVVALMTERVAYQNTLERKFGFSRAKMTRIVQKLERKGLVRKEKAGRTNRLHWKG